MSKSPAAISGVCAVFAESEVINHLSQGTSPSDIMQGAIQSLVDRSIQLMRRVQLQPEYTLVGGILRFESMGRLLVERLGSAVNIPPGDLPQFVGALGAASLGQKRAGQTAALQAIEEGTSLPDLSIRETSPCDESRRSLSSRNTGRTQHG